MKKIGIKDILETKRCIIRIPEESQAEKIWDLVTPNIQKYLIRENIDTIRNSMSQVEKGFLWDGVIYDKITDLPIGRISISYVSEETKSVELGYWLSEELWGKGIIPECVETIVQYAFTVVNYEKVIATCDSDNIQSTQVLSKCNFLHEGTLRNHRKAGKILKDVSFYGILKEDYLSKN